MYDIMKTSFCGYFAYARYLIDLALITSPNLLLPNVNSKFANYVGNIIDNTTEIGHHELAKLHRAKCTVRDLLIDIFMEFGSTIVTHKLTSTVSPLTSNMAISNNEGSSNDTNTPVGYDD